MSELCRLAGTTPGEVRSWSLQCKKPHCENLLRLAINLRATPMKLLLEPEAVGKALRERMNLPISNLIEPSPAPRFRVKGDELEERLSEVLASPEGRSMSLTKVARTLGRTTTVLNTNCRSLCQQIVRNHAGWRKHKVEIRRLTLEHEIQEAVKTLFRNREPLTHHRIRPLVSSMLHPRDALAVRIMKRIIQETAE